MEDCPNDYFWTEVGDKWFLLGKWWVPWWLGDRNRPQHRKTPLRQNRGLSEWLLLNRNWRWTILTREVMCTMVTGWLEQAAVARELPIDKIHGGLSEWLTSELKLEANDCWCDVDGPFLFLETLEFGMLSTLIPADTMKEWRQNGWLSEWLLLNRSWRQMTVGVM